VIAGPSGVGKGTVIRAVMSRIPDRLVLSVSATTRSARPGELEGVDYQFVSDAEFDRMMADGELLEWAPIVGHRSGTPRTFVEHRLAAGDDVLLEIDVKGAEQVRALKPDAVLVFLAPPSLDELERRLRGRQTESEESIALRLDTATWEMAQRGWFDHVVVNDDLERASSQVAAIIEASRT
jgi:guanylate kinase